MIRGPLKGTPTQGTPLPEGIDVNVSEVARIWQAAGVSVIPILDNQTKRPAVRWSPYQVTIPTLGEVDEWWGNGKPYGLALICGAVSGGLELVELEGRAHSGDSMVEIMNRIDELGARHIWERLSGPDGYSEMSPSGGVHLLYRISDHEVPGNTKIASTSEGLCLAETRGHGGYVIVAPTPGVCHPSGQPWDLLDGEYGKLPLITWVERNLIHDALRLALDESPPPQTPAALPAVASPGSGSSAVGLSPGDEYEATTDWAEILEPHGWRLESRHGPTRHWTRPGKETRDGASATTGRANDRDRLYVFSTSTVFAAETCYTKFGAYAVLEHNGDHSAAAKELARQGFGERRSLAILNPLIVGEYQDIDEDKIFDYSDTGNAEYLWSHIHGQYHYVHDAKHFVRWDGRVWAEDRCGALIREMTALTRVMATKALDDENESLAKWARACRNRSKTVAAIDMMRSQEGCTKQINDFDTNLNLLNVENGILNLRTQELSPHDPRYLITRMFAASFNRSARCPQFEEFMAAALPDEGMRTYVQRALGYSLLGNVDQRSLFWIYGPPGTGKSTLMEAMRCVFGDYGSTAASGTFRARGKEHGPTNDLHGLRGKRFVTSSETAESTSFDEDLLKRLSGRDQVTSRALYQENQEWTPECVVWMATNNAPRFNGDDDAIWRRMKLIPFMTVFVGDGEIPDMARSVLAPERDGILNWLLVGLSEYLVYGLGEPETVQEMAREQRAQSDSVARFLDDKITDGVLVLVEGHQVRTNELYVMYTEWARQMGERPLGSRRMYNRIISNFPELEHVKSDGHLYWRGLMRNPMIGAITGFAPYLTNS